MGIRTRYDELIDGLRRSAQPDRPDPPAARRYLELVRGSAYAITDRDVAELEASGLAEDEIFEHTVAAAVGVGLARLAAGMETLE